MYNSGQIIDKSEHVSFANWNNANGGKLRSISLGDGTYRLEEIPAPTTEELAQEKRAERDNLINSISWRIERYNQQKQLGIETSDSENEYMAILQYIQYLRDIPEQEDFPNVDVLSFEQYKGV